MWTGFLSFDQVSPADIFVKMPDQQQVPVAAPSSSLSKVAVGFAFVSAILALVAFTTNHWISMAPWFNSGLWDICILGVCKSVIQHYMDEEGHVPGGHYATVVCCGLAVGFMAFGAVLLALDVFRGQKKAKLVGALVLFIVGDLLLLYVAGNFFVVTSGSMLGYSMYMALIAVILAFVTWIMISCEMCHRRTPGHAGMVV